MSHLVERYKRSFSSHLISYQVLMVVAYNLIPIFFVLHLFLFETTENSVD
jgi:hypothetical protein